MPPVPLTFEGDDPAGPVFAAPLVARLPPKPGGSVSTSLGGRRRSCLSLQDLIVRGGAAFAIAVGAIVFVGLILDIGVLTRVAPGWAPMKTNTALGFIGAGSSLWLLRGSVRQPGAVRLARILAAFVAALGALSLVETLFSIDLGIDQLILPDRSRAPDTARMSPAAAFCFLMIGSSLLALKSGRPRFAALAHRIALPPLLVSILAVAGYTCGVTALHAVSSFATMAVHTAICLLVLPFAILAADTNHGIGKIACSDTAGGMVARRLLLSLPPAIFILGWVCLAGRQAGYYGSPFAMALMILFSIMVCVAAVSWTAARLGQVDLARRAAVADVMALNAELESRVNERTRQLAAVSATLSAANNTLEQLSLHDALTGLANRRYFDTYLAGQIATARRENRPLALVMCDVDAFKAYNDHYGHQAGDACLQRIAAALQSCCRRPADMAARYGGEEFALILPETEFTAAARIAEAAREAVAQLRIPHARSSTAAFVTICGGVSVLPRQVDCTAEMLIAAADNNLFRAKDGGRNRIVTLPARLAV